MENELLMGVDPSRIPSIPCLHLPQSGHTQMDRQDKQDMFFTAVGTQAVMASEDLEAERQQENGRLMQHDTIHLCNHGNVDYNEFSLNKNLDELGYYGSPEEHLDLNLLAECDSQIGPSGEQGEAKTTPSAGESSVNTVQVVQYPDDVFNSPTTDIQYADAEDIEDDIEALVSPPYPPRTTRKKKTVRIQEPEFQRFLVQSLESLGANPDRTDREEGLSDLQVSRPPSYGSSVQSALAETDLKLAMCRHMDTDSHFSQPSMRSGATVQASVLGAGQGSLSEAGGHGTMLRDGRQGSLSDESYYDSVSSTSSTTALLRKVAGDVPKLPAGQETEVFSCSIEGRPAQEVSVEGMTTVGKALLVTTLEQVKKSLEELPSVGMSSQHGGSAGSLKNASDKLSRAYLRNLVVLSISFSLLYTAFLSLRNLQSSLHHSGGLGLASLATISGVFIISCAFAGTIVNHMRPKYAMLVAMFGNLAYIGANFYATPFTLIPASALLGLTMAILWVAQGTYLTSIAVTYAAVTSKKHENVLGTFNGFFLFCLQVAQIQGNLISSAILNFGIGEIWEDGTPEYMVIERGQMEEPHFSPGTVATFNHTLLHANISEIYFEASNITAVEKPAPMLHGGGAASFNSSICGAAYCHSYTIDHASLDVHPYTIVLLLSIFLALTLISMLFLWLGLDKLDVIFRRNKMSIGQQLLGVAKLHRDRRLLLLLNMMVFLGMSEAYVYGEVTKAFITCPYGVHMIGYVMMCFGACDSTMSFLCGQLQRYVHRRILITVGAALHASLLIIVLLWQPDVSRPYLVFLLVGGFGVCDAIWQTQACSLCGMMFESKDRESAFASLRMYEAVGLTLAFVYAQFLCMGVETYLMLGMLVVAIVSYHLMEMVQGRLEISQKYVAVEV